MLKVRGGVSCRRRQSIHADVLRSRVLSRRIIRIVENDMPVIREGRVVKEKDGTVIKTHKTAAEAEKHRRAINANLPKKKK